MMSKNLKKALEADATRLAEPLRGEEWRAEHVLELDADLALLLEVDAELEDGLGWSFTREAALERLARSEALASTPACEAHVQALLRALNGAPDTFTNCDYRLDLVRDGEVAR